MSKFTAGTLVMLKTRTTGRFLNEPCQGAIGEIQDCSGKTDWYIRSGCSVVRFPRNVSDHCTGFWQYLDTNLVPISGPDIDVGTEDVVKLMDKTLVEENV